MLSGRRVNEMYSGDGQKLFEGFTVGQIKQIVSTLNVSKYTDELCQPLASLV